MAEMAVLGDVMVPAQVIFYLSGVVDSEGKIVLILGHPDQAGEVYERLGVLYLPKRYVPAEPPDGTWAAASRLEGKVDILKII